MANTTNYNWETPDDTDLVKDGAAAIRTLGSSIDTTTKNLNPQTTTGALAYRSATANVNTALTIGSTGQVLTVAGGVPTWAAPAGGGKVLQVVRGTGATTFQGIKTASNTDITGMSVSITPSSATSKVLIMGILNGNTSQTATKDKCVIVLADGSNNTLYRIYGSEVLNHSPAMNMPFTYLHSPATTSSITYKLRTNASTAAQGIYVNNFADGGGLEAEIIAMEIGA
jgi:hypothetical protein